MAEDNLFMYGDYSSYPTWAQEAALGEQSFEQDAFDYNHQIGLRERIATALIVAYKGTEDEAFMLARRIEDYVITGEID